MKIYVTSNLNKIKIIKSSNMLEQRKFYTFSDFVYKLLGDVLDKKIYDVIVKYNFTPKHFFEIRSLLPFIDVNKQYSAKLLEKLKNLKIALINEKIFVYDDFFINLLSSSEVIFYSIPITKEVLYLKNYLTKLKIKFIFFEEKFLSNSSFFEFSDNDLELDYVFSQIYNLRMTGVSLNNIYLANTSQYEFYLDFYAKAYNITLDNSSKVSLLAISSVNVFLKTLNLNDLDEELKPKVVNLINKYHLSLEVSDNLKDFLSYLLSNTFLDSFAYSEAVREFTLDMSLGKDDYLFILGADSSFPHFTSRFNFLTNQELLELGFISLENEVNICHEYYLNKLKNTSNLVFTHSLNHFGKDSKYSGIIDLLSLKPEIKEKTFGISKLSDDFVFSKSLDEYYKYGSLSNIFNIYNFSHLNYNTYNYQFKPFNLVLNKFNLSYSSLKDFIDCQFKYYLNYVLKLGTFEPSLSQTIGNYAHEILEYSIGSINLELSTKLKEALTPKESYFISKVDLLLDKLLVFNNQLFKEFSLDKHLFEQKILLDFPFGSFKGFIDRIAYRVVNDVYYFMIIDYKTGLQKFDLEDYDKYKDLQLPIYLYLIYNSDLFKSKNIRLLGLYLQKINLSKNKNEEDLLKSFRLEGYTHHKNISLDVGDLHNIYLANYKLKKDLLPYSYSKIIDDNQIKECLDFIEKTINKFSKLIKNADFKINPKDNEYIKSCEYCKFRNICYVKDSHIIRD